MKNSKKHITQLALEEMNHKKLLESFLENGEKKIEAFLTYLAVKKNVAQATQNQAMNALVFLYKRVLKVPLDNEINSVRAAKKK